MQPINLSDEQREFRATMRRFCEDKIAPRAAEVDHTAEYPWDNFKECVSMELPALGIPEEYGGSGADHVTQAVMVEELSRVCASTSLMMLISKLGMIPVINWGSEEMKRKYLPRVASGEGQASYCLSEPDAGSDVASMKTKAVRDGDDYVITGTKYWITNAGISDTYTVFAKTDPTLGHDGISAFLVEATSPGFEVGRIEPKMGIKGSTTGEIFFNDMRVPARNLLGEEGEGFKIAMRILDRSRPGVAAQGLGIAQGATDYALEYAKSRETMGKPIAQHQLVAARLADMETACEAARGLLYRFALLADEGADGPELTKASAMAKLFCSDVAMDVTTEAVQVLGGYGYIKEYPVERMMRDAKITQIYEGTNEIQRLVIAREMLKENRAFLLAGVA